MLLFGFVLMVVCFVCLFVFGSFVCVAVCFVCVCGCVVVGLLGLSGFVICFWVVV